MKTNLSENENSHRMFSFKDFETQVNENVNSVVCISVNIARDKL